MRYKNSVSNKNYGKSYTTENYFSIINKDKLITTAHNFHFSHSFLIIICIIIVRKNPSITIVSIYKFLNHITLDQFCDRIR